jgi:hypothetical protein
MVLIEEIEEKGLFKSNFNMEIKESEDLLIIRINRLLKLIKNVNESISLHHQYEDSLFMIEQDETLKAEFEKELFELLTQMNINLPLSNAA